MWAPRSERPDRGPRLRRIWQTRGWISNLLLPLSWLYALAWKVRRVLYHRRWLPVFHAPVPVIVVGNVVAGGGGKTPLVIALARRLAARGVRVGIVSRGYGGKSPLPQLVTPRTPARQVGDEPLVIQSETGLPVAVGRQRAEAVQLLLAHHPDLQCILSDDGLQHLGLARDLELCSFSAEGFGNGRLLPAGPLREPWPRHADWVLAPAGSERAELIGLVQVSRSLARRARRADGQTRALHSFAGQNAVALAGIAHPESFFSMLEAEGIGPLERHPLPDHADLQDLQLPTDRPVLCTRKDAVKLWAEHPLAWAVDLELNLPDTFWAEFERRVEAKLSSLHGPSTP